MTTGRINQGAAAGFLTGHDGAPPRRTEAGPSHRRMPLRLHVRPGCPERRPARVPIGDFFCFYIHKVKSQARATHLLCLSRGFRAKTRRDNFLFFFFGSESQRVSFPKHLHVQDRQTRTRARPNRFAGPREAGSPKSARSLSRATELRDRERPRLAVRC